MNTLTIGIDVAKSVFQAHGVDENGNVTIRRQLKRRYVLLFFKRLQPCLIGMEACVGTLLVARVEGAWSHGAVNAGSLREALRQTAEE